MYLMTNLMKLSNIEEYRKRHAMFTLYVLHVQMQIKVQIQIEICMKIQIQMLAAVQFVGNSLLSQRVA